MSTAATTRNEVGTLGELLKQLTVNDVGRLFVEEATRMGLTDGLAIPTSGLRHARGFFGVDNVAAEDLAKVDRSLMCAVAQHAHLRIDRIEEEHGAGIDGLSPREAEILNWVAAGKSNPETAMILGISEATVGTHLKRLFTKLGVHDRVSAVLAGFKLGMLR